nr:peptidase S8, subtilisin-related protein [Tanacetum cinerariifolium]
MVAGLPKLFDTIISFFQPIKGSVMHTFFSTQLEIKDRSWYIRAVPCTDKGTHNTRTGSRSNGTFINEFVPEENFLGICSRELLTRANQTISSAYFLLNPVGHWGPNANALGNYNYTAAGMDAFAYLKMYKVWHENGFSEIDIVAAMDAVLMMELIGSARNEVPFNASLSNEAPWIFTVGTHKDISNQMLLKIIVLKDSGYPQSFATEIRILSRGPSKSVSQYSGCLVNGYRFHTQSREMNRKGQNSGIVISLALLLLLKLQLHLKL